MKMYIKMLETNGWANEGEIYKIEARAGSRTLRMTSVKTGHTVRFDLDTRLNAVSVGYFTVWVYRLITQLTKKQQHAQ